MFSATIKAVPNKKCKTPVRDNYRAASEAKAGAAAVFTKNRRWNNDINAQNKKNETKQHDTSSRWRAGAELHTAHGCTVGESWFASVQNRWRRCALARRKKKEDINNEREKRNTKHKEGMNKKQ